MSEVEVGRIIYFMSGIIIYFMSGIISTLIGVFNIPISISKRDKQWIIIWTFFIVVGILLLLLFLSTFGTLVW